jgi:UDP-N-acetylglucosamine--N-acetylmuramyl-(pentapeptide) pyrophosphoryl-undecaprenol N-acetylglucosamine transferase
MALHPQYKKIRIIIAGGGTGGHIFPAIAVAQAIQKIQPDAAILFVGALGKMEMEQVPKAGYEIIGITIAGFNRTHILKNLSLPWKLLMSYFQVKAIIKKFKPNAVFGVGGYSSFPVLKQAQSKSIPTFIHESNAFAGKANQWLGADATQIFTGTKGMESFFPAHKIQVTGNPVRQNIINTSFNKNNAVLHFGLIPNKKTVLIVGGSLGASSINKTIQSNLATFSDNNIQLIWQTGKPGAGSYVNAANDYANVYVSSFIDDMSAAYTAADIVVSRSGAMAVAEISITGKAAIFVPYPHAAEDHQTYNAMALVDNGAAKMVKDSEVNQKLIPLLQSLIQDDQSLQLMQEKIKAYAFTNADEVIAQQILQHI